jgi:hypothetical protein
MASRLDQRAAQSEPTEPLRLPAPLNQLPWDVAKDQFGPQGADFIGVMGALIVRAAKDQIRLYLLDPGRTSPISAKDQFRPPAYSDSARKP